MGRHEEQDPFVVPGQISDVATVHLGNLIEAVPAGVIAVDRDGVIRLANEAAATMFGLAQAELVGSSVERLVPEGMRPRHKGLRDSYVGEPRVMSLGKGRDLRALRSDGSEFPAEIGLGIMAADEGPLVVAVVVDVTDRLAAEAQTERALAREHQAVERLKVVDELKTTFLHAVSHDLRTPLTAILGLSLTLEREDLELPLDERRDLSHRISVNARRLDSLLSDLLDLERLDRGLIEPKRSPTDIAALVGDVIRDVSSEAGVGNRSLHVDAQPVSLAVDRAKVERIVENLLSNAVRHTPEGSDIWIEVRRVPEGVLISVEDSGPGIDESDRERIFEAFARADEDSPSPGLGIGLSLVRRFTELHGGRVWVEEREGGGASFKVLLA